MGTTETINTEEFDNKIEWLKPFDKDIAIYKIIPFNYLISWLSTKKIQFNQVVNWPDVFEFLSLKQNWNLKTSSNDILHINVDYVLHTFYGQSWSMEEESVALWETYSPNYMSVKIKTTTKKLKKVIDNSQPDPPYQIYAYAGRVDYLSKDDLLNYTKHLDLSTESLAKSVFTKRKDYKYEDEFRIVLQYATQSAEEPAKDRLIGSFIELDIDPENFIEEACFDYRLSDAAFCCMKCCLSKFLPDNIIIKSDLGYFLPQERFVYHD